MKQKMLSLMMLIVMLPQVTMAEEKETLWSGDVDLTSSTWTTYCTIDAEKVKTLQAGDRILVTVAAASTGTSQWPSVNLYSNSTALGHQYGFWTEAANSESFPITKEEYLSKSDIETLKSNSHNLKLSGAGCRLTKVEVVRFNSTLWEGTTEEFAWGTYYTMPTSLVGDLVAGDIVRVTVSEANFVSGSKWPQLRYSSKSESSDRKDQYNTVSLQNTAVYANGAAYACPYIVDYVVPEADLTVLQEKNSLYLTGSSIKISKVELIKKPDLVTVLVPVMLWSGNQEVTDGWSGHQTVTAAMLTDAQAGDEIAVTVSAVSSTAGSPQVDFRKHGWSSGSYGTNVSLSGVATPYTEKLTLTSEILADIRTNGDFYVTGCGYTFTRIDLIRHITVDPSIEKGNAVTNLWTGSEAISWVTGSNNSVLIDKSKFANVTAGMKIRMTVKDVPMGGGTGRILHGWTGFDGVVNASFKPREMGTYYEYELTEAMITGIQTDGLRISGNQYTLTSVDLINPAKEYTVISAYDPADIKAWESGETPNMTVTLTNCEATEVKTYVELVVYTDMFEYYKTFTSGDVSVASGETKDVTVNMDLEPGFYRMIVNANNNHLCTYYIGYDPTAISSPNDAQPDFWQFWDKWVTRLEAIPVDATLTLLADQSTGARNVYEVKYQSVPETVGGSPVYIYGYYAEPKAEGTYPCRINFHGTDNGSSTPAVPGTDSNMGWCEFSFSARGQMLDRQKNGNTKYIPEGKTSPDFYAYRLGDNDEHYYRYTYLDTRRAVDFVCTQTKVNKDQIFAVGGSQGGCLTYVCAALSDGRIRAIAPSITGHADFVHTMDIVTWPTNVFNNWINAQVEAGTYANYAEGKNALLRHQSYFDTKNFASRITCPVITNFSLQDNTDGPHLNISPYNLLTHVATADKEYSINPFKGHASADNWETTYMTFFQRYISAGAKAKSFFLNSGSEGWATLCLDFKVEVPAGCTVYTAIDKNEANRTITLKAHDASTVLEANTAVVVKGDEALTDYLFTESASVGTQLENNLLQGVTERTAVSMLNGDNGVLVLGKKNGEIGFYSASVDYLPAHRAYIAMRNDVYASALGFAFIFDNEATDVNEGLRVTSDVFTTVPVFNLKGQCVMQPAKGLYLVNGKKVIIK